MRAFTLQCLILTAAVTTGSAAHARTLTGRVYVDSNGDGAAGAEDEPVVGAVVVWGTTVFSAPTDATGAFTMTVPDAKGIAWVRTPDGFQPAPSFARFDADAADIAADLALVPANPAAGASFVVMSDSHAGKSEFEPPTEGDLIDSYDLELAMLQATAGLPTPAFMTITGDIAQSGHADQFEIIKTVVDDFPVPFVPVPGNHDWFDGGATYESFFGPSMYSFDMAGAHFVVLNDNASVNAWTSFLRSDLALVDAGTTVIAFIHRPPEDPELEAIESAGVRYLFTGHWHSNGMFRYGDLVELNTEPVVRGGIDTTPAGYRIAMVVDGDLQLAHHTVVDSPVVDIAYPRATDCLDPVDTELLVAVQVDARRPAVSAVVDGGEAIELAPAGGWLYRGTIRAGAEDRTVVTVTVAVDGQPDMTATQTIPVCTPIPAPTIAPWPQLQGDAQHLGFSPTPVGPPLRTVWARAVGGHVHGGSPIVADGAAIVAFTDFNDGTGSGVVAFDAATGDERWRYLPGVDVRAAPAAADGLVVVSLIDGQIHAVDIATGQLAWTYDLGTGIEENTAELKAPPVIADGAVYVGVQHRFAAIDLSTGVELWSTNPAPDYNTLSSCAGAAVGDGVAVGVFGRGRGGLVAWDALTGDELWRIPRPDSIGIHGSPIIHDGVAYFVNAKGSVRAVDLATGEYRWTEDAFSGNSDWDYAAVATPALADGRLFVPTQYDDLVSVKAGSGAQAWRESADHSPLHISHARAATRAFSSSPVVTDGVLWVASSDGTIQARVPSSGALIWQTSLGAPITSGIAPAGDLLFVASYDGTLRAMANTGEVIEPPPEPEAGCGCAVPGPHAPGTALVWGFVLAALIARRRRQG